MIAHVVLFEPKSGVSPSGKKEFLDEIRSVARNIKVIAKARVGKTISMGVMPENTFGHKTYEYAAVFEFASSEDLATYLAHPGHDRLRSLFWELCQATLIADLDLVDPSSGLADSLV